MNKKKLNAELTEIANKLGDLVQQVKSSDIPHDTKEKFRQIGQLSRKLVAIGMPRNRMKPKVETKPADPALVELQKQLSLVRDRIRGVAVQGHAGFYLYGRPGTSKTHTVRMTLEQLGVPHVYQNGHLTPLGLFEIMEENSDKVIVLDDVGAIFSQPAAKNILLAALGAQPNGIREVKYKRQGVTVKVEFTGGIIAISNLELHGDELIGAIKSRVQTLNYDPSDDQIIALMRSIAFQGYTGQGGRATSSECKRVMEFLVGRCSRYEIRPDIRMFVDKALKDFLLWKSGESETHWEDLIESAIQDRLTELKHPVESDVPSKEEEILEELRLVEKLIESEGNKAPEKFKVLTGKTLRTFQRRTRQLKSRIRINR